MNTFLKLVASTCLSLWIIGGVAAHADTITVTTASDIVAVDSQCSFREAITAANTDAAYQGCAAGSGPDTIVFGVTGAVTVSTAPPTVTTPITVDGIGVTLVLSSTTGSQRLKQDIGSTGALTLTNTSITGRTCGLWIDKGTLTLQSSTLRSCFSGFGSTPGAVTNDGGRLYVSNSVFADNGSYQGAAITNKQGGEAHITNSTFRSNDGRSGSAIFNGELLADPADVASMLWVTNSLFVDNSVGGGGWFGRGVVTSMGHATLVGNLFVDNFYAGGNDFGAAGVIWSTGALTVTQNTFRHNHFRVSGVEQDHPDYTFAGVFARPDESGNIQTSYLIISNTFSEGIGVVANYSSLFGGEVITLPITLTLENNTFVNAGKVITNRAQIEVYTNTTVFASANVIVDTTIGKDCLLMGGVISDLGRNFASDSTCAYSGTGSHNSIDPMLGPLANNDGVRVGAGADGDFLPTYRPLTGSPACATLPCAGAVATPTAPMNIRVYLPLAKRTQ